MSVTIVSPDELLLALQVQAQGVSEFVAQLGGNADNVLLYDREGDLATAIEQLRPPAVLLYFDGIQPLRAPSRFRYLVGMAIRSKNPAAIFQTFLQGVSASPGSDLLPLLCSTIHPRFHPMDVPTLERQQVVTQGGKVFELFVLRTGFSDKGSN